MLVSTASRKAESGVKARRRIAVIDVGSNSVRMVIHELLGRAMQPSFNEKLLAGLGRGLGDTKKLHPEGVELALAALGRFARIARAQACSMVIPFATAAVREALDGPDFGAPCST